MSVVNVAINANVKRARHTRDPGFNVWSVSAIVAVFASRRR